MVYCLVGHPWLRICIKSAGTASSEALWEKKESSCQSNSGKYEISEKVTVGGSKYKFYFFSLESFVEITFNRLVILIKFVQRLLCAAIIVYIAFLCLVLGLFYPWWRNQVKDVNCMPAVSELCGKIELIPRQPSWQHSTLAYIKLLFIYCQGLGCSSESCTWWKWKVSCPENCFHY